MKQDFCNGFFAIAAGSQTEEFVVLCQRLSDETSSGEANSFQKLKLI